MHFKKISELKIVKKDNYIKIMFIIRDSMKRFLLLFITAQKKSKKNNISTCLKLNLSLKVFVYTKFNTQFTKKKYEYIFSFIFKLVCAS